MTVIALFRRLVVSPAGPGYGTDLLYIAGLLALAIGGAGPLSLDRRLSARRKRRGREEPYLSSSRSSVFRTLP